MTSLDEAVLVRLDHGGNRFEVFVDSNLAYDFKKGKEIDPKEVLVSRDIFRDAKKGLRVSEDELLSAFGTTDSMKAAIQIIRKGDLQLTTEQRRNFQEEKKRKISSLIAREAIDPRTKAPHTQKRVEEAIEQAKVKIDPFKSAEEQVEEVVKALKSILPLKFEKIRISVKIPPEYTGRAYAVVRRYKVVKEEWQKDGSLLVMVEIPPGLQERFFRDVNNVTDGNSETKIVD